LSGFRHFYVFFPVPHVVVHVGGAVPTVVRRDEVLQLLRGVLSIPQLVVWRLGVSTQLRSSENTRNCGASPVINTPSSRNEQFVLSNSVKRLSIS
jgi:hypothetical protein